MIIALTAAPILHLGPLAFDSERLLGAAALWLFVALGSHRRLIGEARPDAAIIAATTGFIVARITFVAFHASAFLREPLSFFAVWEGGFSIWAGIVAVAVVLAWQTKGRARIKLLGLLLTIAAVWWGIQRLTTSAVASPFAQSNLALTKLDGRPAVLDRSDARPTVVNLWADWCPPCRREMPIFADAVRENPSVNFLFVNQGDTASTAARLPARYGIDLAQVILDPGAQLSAAYGGALPTTLFLNADGSVRTVHAGAISRAGLTQQIDQIKEPRP